LAAVAAGGREQQGQQLEAATAGGGVGVDKGQWYWEGQLVGVELQQLLGGGSQVRVVVF
jgi:hypothetical protein